MRNKVKKESPMNPFMNGSEIPVFRIHKKVILKDKSKTEDEEIVYSEFVVSYTVDRNERTKIFQLTRLTGLFSSLSPIACKLLLRIMSTLRYNEDMISLRQETIAKEFGVTKPTINNAIRNLTEYSIIQRYDKGHYWINPMIVFYGRRIDKYKSNLKYEDYGIKQEIDSETGTKISFIDSFKNNNIDDL